MPKTAAPLQRIPHSARGTPHAYILAAYEPEELFRDTSRASPEDDERLQRIYKDNLLSATTLLGDVDSTLELLDFVTDNIIGQRPVRSISQRHCLKQKALTLLAGEA